MKITTQIRLLTLGVIFLTLCLASGYFLYNTLQLLLASEKANRANQLELRSQQFINSINNLRTDVQTLAGSPLLLEWLRMREQRALNLEKLEDLLADTFANILQQKNAYFQVRVLDAGGVELLRLDRSATGPVRIPTEMLQNKSQRNYFLEAKKIPRGEVYLSSIDLNKEFGHISYPEVVTLRALAPITIDRQRLGYVAINIDVGPYVQAAIKIHTPEQAFIVDEKGEFIAHEESAKTFASQRGDTQLDLTTEYPEIAQKFQWQKHSTGQTLEHETSRYNVNAQQVFFDPSNSSRYLVIYQLLDKRFLQVRLLSKVSRQIIAMLLLVGLGVILATITGSMITRRVLQLKQLVNGMGRGETNLVAPEPRRDEIDEVADTLIALSEKVKLREHQLQRKEQHTRAILNTVKTGVITIDGQGAMVDVNAYAAGIFGYEQQELTGKNVRKLMPKEFAQHHDSFLRQRSESEDKGAINIARELFGLLKDGTIFPIQLTVSEHREDAERFFVGAIDDISVRLSQEESLRDYARKLEHSNIELENFAYLASHDLQEPVRKIQAFMDLIQATESERLSGEGKSHLQRCSRAARKMQDLIHAMLNLSRIKQVPEDMEFVDLNQLCDEVLESLHFQIEQQGASVRVELLPTVQGAPILLRQLFFNLISNALKYVQPGTRPFVRIRPFSMPPNAPLDDRRLLKDSSCVCVEDNGIGIKPGHSRSIFRPFERLHGQDSYQGTGMGLAICKKIIESGGGEMYLDEDYKTGSRFVIVFSGEVRAKAARVPQSSSN